MTKGQILSTHFSTDFHGSNIKLQSSQSQRKQRPHHPIDSPTWFQQPGRFIRFWELGNMKLTFLPARFAQVAIRSKIKSKSNQKIKCNHSLHWPKTSFQKVFFVKKTQKNVAKKDWQIILVTYVVWQKTAGFNEEFSFRLNIWPSPLPANISLPSSHLYWLWTLTCL